MSHNIEPKVLKLLNGEILIGTEKLNSCEYNGFLAFYNVAQIYIDHNINRAFLKEWIPGVPPNEVVKIYPDRILAMLSAGKVLTDMYKKNFFPFMLDNEDEIPEAIPINREVISYGGDVTFKLL